MSLFAGGKFGFIEILQFGLLLHKGEGDTGERVCREVERTELRT